MALIVCPECGNQVSDQARMCPKCGYLLQESKTDKAKKWVLGRKNVIIFLVTVIFLGALTFFALRTGLNDYEKQALENCQALQQVLKNPQSFSLCGDIYACPEEDDYYDFETIYYISYSGTNSYGGVVQHMAVFNGNKYMGDYSDEESDFYDEEDYSYFVLACFPYKLCQNNNNFDELISIDSDKIMHHLEKN